MATIHADFERLRRSMDTMFEIQDSSLQSMLAAIRESRDEFRQAFHEFKEGLRQDLCEFRAGINEKSEIVADSQNPDSQIVMIPAGACFLLPLSSVVFAGDGKPDWLIHEIATNGVEVGSEKKSKPEQFTSMARHVFDPMPLQKKLWQNLRTKTFSKTWWFKFKEPLITFSPASDMRVAGHDFFVFSDALSPSVTRVLYTDKGVLARRYVKNLMALANLSVREDDVGNIFERWDGLGLIYVASADDINLVIISAESPAFAVVLNFLLPLVVPILLFRADLRRVIQSTGRLLLVFLIGSVATTVGTALAYFLVPMRSLGPDSWKIAAALMERHIGGAVNYVAIANALEVSPSVLAAGLAADNVICDVYFTTLVALGSKIPAESSPPPTSDAEMSKGSETKNKIPVVLIATGIAVSLAICKAGALLTLQEMDDLAKIPVSSLNAKHSFEFEVIDRSAKLQRRSTLIWLPDNIFSLLHIMKKLLKIRLQQNQKKRKSHKTYMFKYKQTKDFLTCVAVSTYGLDYMGRMQNNMELLAVSDLREGKQLSLQEMDEHTTVAYDPNYNSEAKVSKRFMCRAIHMESGEPERLSFDNLLRKTKDVWSNSPQPIKEFPLNRAFGNFIQLILDLTISVVKFLFVPILAVSSISKMSYCAHERKLALVPFPLVIGMIVAGILQETALNISDKRVNTPLFMTEVDKEGVVEMGKEESLALQAGVDLTTTPVSRFNTNHSCEFESLFMIAVYELKDRDSRVWHRWKSKETNERKMLIQHLQPHGSPKLLG